MNKFQQNSINFYCNTMDKKNNFVEQLNNQLKEYQIQKIVLNQQKHSKHNKKIHQTQAKQTLIDLGDMNESVEIIDHQLSICRWNNKKDIEIPQLNQIITKRNNLLTERYRHSQNRLDTLRSFSTKQIPNLKLLLQKLQTPTKKKKNYQRGVLTSAPRVKKDSDYQNKVLIQKHLNVEEQIFYSKGPSTERRMSSHRPNTMQRKDTQNKNPILYPINEIIKEKRKAKQYQKINRKNSNHWNNILKNTVNCNVNQLTHQKQLLQNLIKNTITNQGIGAKINSQTALNFLDQYNNFNHFSNNFKNEGKKKGTLTNLLI